MKLIFVTPRYGREVVGGAETLVRDYAEHLAAAGHDITVFSTCARDHFSWANVLAEGETMESGVKVRRFPVSRAKDNTRMHSFEVSLAAGLRLPADSEREWVANTGLSDRMLDAIATTADSVDALLFAPYLFASTVFGAALRPDRSIIIPCLHDEAYARFDCTRATMRGVAGMIFNSDAERDTADRLLGGLPNHAVVGVGFDPPDHVDAPAFRQSHRIHGDVVSYAGRREAGKNFPLLLECVAAHNTINQTDPIDLVVMGRGEYVAPSVLKGHVVDVGYVDPATKLNGFAASVAVSNLSTNESFSYVVMEAWLAGTPVIVDRGCAVTREHCEASGGGVWVASPEEWSEAVTRLRQDTALRDRLSRAGRTYVEQRYSWPAVMQRLESAITKLIT